MTSSASPAPLEELASLRARVQQFESQMVERDVLLEQRAATIEQHEATIERLQEQVRLLLARRDRGRPRHRSHGNWAVQWRFQHRKYMFILVNTCL